MRVDKSKCTCLRGKRISIDSSLLPKILRFVTQETKIASVLVLLRVSVTTPAPQELTVLASLKEALMFLAL